VHWTRGPSNVSRRIRLTPRNRRAEAHRFVKSINFSSRCPKTGFRAFAEKPVAKSQLLPQFGGQKMPPKGLQSLIASLPGPSHKSPHTRRSTTTCFLAQPIPTHPWASPFDALISMPAQHVLERTPEGTSRNVLTDQIRLPKVSRSPQRRTFLHHPEASLEPASFRLPYHKTAQKLFSNTAGHFCQHLRRHARVPDPGQAHCPSDDP